MTINSTYDEESAPAPVTFWHNGICFQRLYERNPITNCVYVIDTAIVGDSFYISPNVKEKRIRSGYYSSDNDEFIKAMSWGESHLPICDDKDAYRAGSTRSSSIHSRFSEKASSRLLELSVDNGAPISEMYARLMTPLIHRDDIGDVGIPEMDLHHNYKGAKEILAYTPPSLTCAPDDGFPPPRFPYTGDVIFIGNGWKMRHLLGRSNVAFS